MASKESELDAKRVAVVNRYATPLAIMLVLLGIFLTQPTQKIQVIGYSLLIFGILFNVLSARWILGEGGDPSKAGLIVKVRMSVNLAVNLLLIYYLGGYWTPIWLLLSLTPLAAAIYGSRKRTLRSAATVSVLLVGIQAARGLHSPQEWGEQLVYVGYIFLISLLVNELAMLNREAQSSGIAPAD